MPPTDARLLDSLRRIGAVAPEVIELFDYLEDTPLWMKDAAGHYQWVNVSFRLNFGLRPADAIRPKLAAGFLGDGRWFF